MVALAGLAVLVPGCGTPPAPEKQPVESWSREDWIMTCVDAEQHEGFAPLTRLTLHYPDGRTTTVFEMENGDLLPSRVGTHVTCSYAPAPTPGKTDAGRTGTGAPPPKRPPTGAGHSPG